MTSARRTWLAIGASTVLALFSFSYLLAALVEDTGEDINRSSALGIGLALVPFVFVTLAFLSRHRRAPAAVLKAIGVWVLVTLAAGLASVVMGLTLGFGVAGVFALRAEEWQRYSIRFAGLGIAAVYTLLMLILVPGFGLFTAGVIPLVALGLADAYSNHLHDTAGEEA